MKKRKIKRYRNARRNSGMKFIGFIGIMVAAVICGYLTARFVIAPLLGYDTEVLKLDFPSKLTGLLEDRKDAGNQPETDLDEKDTDDGSDGDADEPEAADTAGTGSDEQGYVLQFGIFSSETRAEELASKLRSDGISCSVKKAEEKYRVIGPLISTKEKAVDQLKEIQTSHVSGIFIAAIK